jgi:flagellar protein FlaJ
MPGFSTGAKVVIYTLGGLLAAFLAYYGFINYFPTHIFHSFIAFALIAAIGPPALIQHLEESRRKAIDESLPLLLDDIGQGQEIGLTLLQTLEEVSKRDYGPLTEEVRRLAAKLSWGVNFEKAFIAFSERIGTELVSKISVLILEAIALGGDLKTTFNETAKFVRRILELRRERENEMRPYFMVIYVTVLIFVVVMIILYQSFFAPIAEQRPETRFLRLPLTAEEYKTVLFDMGVIQAIFGGITAGKLSEGRFVAGLKHSVLLLIIVSTAFTVFL